MTILIKDQSVISTDYHVKQYYRSHTASHCRRVDRGRRPGHLGGVRLREEEAVGQRVPAPQDGREPGGRQPKLPGPHVPALRRPGLLPAGGAVDQLREPGVRHHVRRRRRGRPPRLVGHRAHPQGSRLSTGGKHWG